MVISVFSKKLAILIMSLSTLRPMHISREDDILVVGYIRQSIENKFNISIPTEIIKICHSFWGFFACDEWDEAKSYHTVTIIGPRFSSNDKVNHSVYGKQIIKSGIYHWKIKMIKKASSFYENHPFVGIVRDENILGKYSTDCMWCNRGGYLLCGASNLIAPPSSGKSYGSQPFVNTGDVLELILDLKKKTIKYIINDKDQGIAFKNVRGVGNSGYRFAVGMIRASECEFEFL